MPEMYLRQPGFTYSASEPFTRNKERIKKIKETADSRCIYQNEQIKLVFNMIQLMEILLINSDLNLCQQ